MAAGVVVASDVSSRSGVVPLTVDCVVVVVDSVV